MGEICHFEWVCYRNGYTSGLVGLSLYIMSNALARFLRLFTQVEYYKMT